MKCFLKLVLFCVLYSKSYSQNNLNFREVLRLVREIEKPIVLSNHNASIIISKHQSQVISSTVDRSEGYSYGWLNKKAIAKNKKIQQYSFYGGEDRLWFNPLGSKYSLYYNQKEIKPEHWKVPLFYKELFSVIHQNSKSVELETQTQIVNNIGSVFDIAIKRKINIHTTKEVEKNLKLSSLKKVKCVAFSSETTVTNVGDDWQETKGLITPWVMGMFKGTATSVTMFPYTEKQLVLKPNQYFLEGKKGRWKKDKRILYFKTDGSLRSKIGIPIENVIPLIGNYDSKNKRLTIITYSFDSDGAYLSTLETNSAPMYKGDVGSSYNNDVSELGSSFYELESTAAAKVLRAKESILHKHTTYHFEGNLKDLNKISKRVLKCDLKQIKDVF